MVDFINILPFYPFIMFHVNHIKKMKGWILKNGIELM